MRPYLLSISFLCLLTSGCTDAGEKTDLSPEEVKGLLERIEKGMSRSDVDKITGIRGDPKGNDSPLERLFYYDYDKSYLCVLYSFRDKGKTVTVKRAYHKIDNLTIEQRHENRRQARRRGVRARNEHLRKRLEAEKKREAEKKAGNVPNPH